MAFREIGIMDIWEVIRRWHDHHSISQIAHALGYDGKTVRRNARRQHERLGKKIQNLLSLAEDGVADSVVLRERLIELERGRTILSSQIQRAERVKAPKRVEDAAQSVRVFIQDFRTKFEHSPIEIQKLVVQKCVFAINVDPDGHYADVFVRTIPAVTPEIEKALNSEESKALVAAAACARNRT